MRRVALTLYALAAIALPGAPKADEPAAQADLPAEVDALIFRNASCNWSTINRNNDSTVQVEASRRYFKCDAIAEDLATLRKHYQSDPRVLKALDGAILPADVDDIIQRRVGCELTKKASEQPNRTTESSAAHLYLNCVSLAKDEAILRQKYSGDPRILKVLDAKWVRGIKVVPLKIAPQTDTTAPLKERPNVNDR
jgi:hypothetical protein